MANKDNIPRSFGAYEKQRLLKVAKRLRDSIVKNKAPNSSRSEEHNKEPGTLKTAFGVFKEAWTKTGKDFKRTIGYKIGESVCSGLHPYVSSMLLGALPALTKGTVMAMAKFGGAAALEIIRGNLEELCRFKAKIAGTVLNDTLKNAASSSLYEEILHKPRPYFKINSPGSLSDVVNQTISAKNKLLNSSVECMSRAVVFGISSATLFAVDPKLAIGVLGITALNAEFGGYLNKTYRQLNNKLSSFNSRIGKENIDSIKNTPLVQDVNRVETEAENMRNRLDKSSKITQKINYAKGKAHLKMSTAVNVGLQGLIMAAICADVVKTGDIGRFVLISSSSWRMLSSGNMLSELWTQLSAEKHRLIDTSRKLITPKELARDTGNEKLSAENTKISLYNVSFAYPKIKDITDLKLAEGENRNGEIKRGEDVLKNVNIEFDKGRLTAVVGQSGQGKSTLMSLIRHDYDAQEGAVFIGDKNVQDLSDEEINAQIAFVDQKVHFFDDSIGYNLKYFNPNATKDEILTACRLAGIDKDILKFEDGLNHKIGQDGSALSGGQMQRLALARVFLTDKPVVIMDEPTTGLDPKLSMQVIKALKELAKDKTVIMVTHNPTEIALADRCVVVENGNVSADGKPIDLVKTSEFLKQTLTKADIENKRRLYSNWIKGDNYQKETAEILGDEASGKVLTDEERRKKLQLLSAHKRAYVGTRKNAMIKQRVNDGKPLPQYKGKPVSQAVIPVAKGGAEI